MKEINPDFPDLPIRKSKVTMDLISKLCDKNDRDFTDLEYNWAIWNIEQQKDIKIMVDNHSVIARPIPNFDQYKK